jgi:hypothetical protein
VFDDPCVGLAAGRLLMCIVDDVPCWPARSSVRTAGACARLGSR